MKLTVISIIILTILFTSCTNQFIDSEEKAIELIKQKFPEFRDYPSDEFAGRSIETQTTAEGYYLGFIIYGSGVPIADATCFFVDKKGNIKQDKYQPKELINEEIDLVTCS
ncbi:hypothetical protein HOD20_07935 [archaeon]|jgi:hypothetical protein|nr:hypothetical protein [archaeon]MBT4352438.1 hypothetical protein [archaeon]MBT4648033.1 hypothetical protein [archaeon]MBT6822713.1 hypothetical protein [archaeon]MBT7392456.1 hypothetical protein [archaeon]